MKAEAMKEQRTNPGRWNIGQQARPVRSMIRADWPRIRQCIDRHGFVTVQAVREYDNGFISVQVGEETWLPVQALIF